MARKLSYAHDLENFERDLMFRQMSYTDDFETHRSLCHKQSVLFYGHPCRLKRRINRIKTAFLMNRNSQKFLDLDID